jgi:hypothetical protein
MQPKYVSGVIYVVHNSCKTNLSICMPSQPSEAMTALSVWDKLYTTTVDIITDTVLLLQKDEDGIQKLCALTIP